MARTSPTRGDSQPAWIPAFGDHALGLLNHHPAGQRGGQLLVQALGLGAGTMLGDGQGGQVGQVGEGAGDDEVGLRHRGAVALSRLSAPRIISRSRSRSGSASASAEANPARTAAAENDGHRPAPACRFWHDQARRLGRVADDLVSCRQRSRPHCRCARKKLTWRTWHARCSRRASPKLRAAGLDIRADLAEPVAACADPGRIHQVIEPARQRRPLLSAGWRGDRAGSQGRTKRGDRGGRHRSRHRRRRPAPRVRPALARAHRGWRGGPGYRARGGT